MPKKKSRVKVIRPPKSFSGERSTRLSRSISQALAESSQSRKYAHVRIGDPEKSFIED